MADWKQVLSTANIATARLIVQLQMQDAAQLATSSPSSQIQSDAQIARKIFEDELKALQGEFPGRALGELIACNDNKHQAALESAAYGWNFDESINKVNQAPLSPVQLIRCVACTDEEHPANIVTAPCKHHYCHDCLENLFRSSMIDETLYPPRCCKKPIPINDAREALPRDLSAEFVNRREEFETKDKTYCHRPHCSTFIRPYVINGDLARCPRCHEATCVQCKGKWHFGDCPRDEGVQQLLATAQENHWRQCPECKRVIELAHGCYHISYASPTICRETA